MTHCLPNITHPSISLMSPSPRPWFRLHPSALLHLSPLGLLFLSTQSPIDRSLPFSWPSCPSNFRAALPRWSLVTSHRRDAGMGTLASPDTRCCILLAKPSLGKTAPTSLSLSAPEVCYSILDLSSLLHNYPHTHSLQTPSRSLHLLQQNLLNFSVLKQYILIL